MLKLNNNKNFLKETLKKLSLIVWVNYDISSLTDKETREIKFWRYVYSTIIIFACLISFANVFIPTGSEVSLSVKTIITIGQIPVIFIFSADFILHLITYQFHYQKNSKSYLTGLRFLITYHSIVIILCILASINLIGLFVNLEKINQKFLSFLTGFSIVRILRLFLVLQVFAPFKIIFLVCKSQQKVLINVFFIVLVIIFLFALVIWNTEISFFNQKQQEFTNKFLQQFPNAKGYIQGKTYNILQHYSIEQLKWLGFNYPEIPSNAVSNFWDSLYFTTITLTTIGYGDFSAQSVTAKMLVIIISIMGIAVIAIPSAVIAGAFLQHLQSHINKNQIKE
ncbi:potassium channel family protein [Mycoplasmopsis cricetuli]|uniref:potassium channel family protein n=1 Tax=Mycoplasmopsis cricetuli TaxID=171283 RepID=UPI000470ACE2|nr:potassium channel family protein [Mycoplasmopsis cricetuli]